MQIDIDQDLEEDAVSIIWFMKLNLDKCWCHLQKGVYHLQDGYKEDANENHRWGRGHTFGPAQQEHEIVNVRKPG